MVWYIFMLLFISNTTKSIYGQHRQDIMTTATEGCASPCACPPSQPGCQECQECPSHVGEPCSKYRPCDIEKGIICKYRHDDLEGICEKSSGISCVIYNKTYGHGTTFSLDCRTQCTCQNGTYGCSSLCPQEHIIPNGACKHPRLIEIPGHCCREWMCDSRREISSSCQPAISKWSSCSTECGVGLSTRHSNMNARCETVVEPRLCQIRRCHDSAAILIHRKHHVRKGHECKATHRRNVAVNLHFGLCKSQKRYRPKYCGACPFSEVICKPFLSTTVNIEFLCKNSSSSDKLQTNEDNLRFISKYAETSKDLWSETEFNENESNFKVSLSVQWILKCRCERVAVNPTSSTGEIILHRVHRTAAP